jgi:hypothetical protein
MGSTILSLAPIRIGKADCLKLARTYMRFITSGVPKGKILLGGKSILAAYYVRTPIVDLPKRSFLTSLFRLVTWWAGIIGSLFCGVVAL